MEDTTNHTESQSVRDYYKCKTVEDEIHFLCECSNIIVCNNLEQIIQNINPGYKWQTAEQKFVYLLESTNKLCSGSLYSHSFLLYIVTY